MGAAVIWLRVKFVKRDILVYLSHLDIVRLFERLLRRADAPLVFSQGFTPRPKMLFSRALPLGVESDGEFLDVGLDLGAGDPRLPKLQADLVALAHPPGTVLSSRILADGEATIDRAVARARCSVDGRLGGGQDADATRSALDRLCEGRPGDDEEAALFGKVSDAEVRGESASSDGMVTLTFTGLAAGDDSLSLSRMRKWLQQSCLSVDRFIRTALLDADGKPVG